MGRNQCICWIISWMISMTTIEVLIASVLMKIKQVWFHWWQYQSWGDYKTAAIAQDAKGSKGVIKISYWCGKISNHFMHWLEDDIWTYVHQFYIEGCNRESMCKSNQKNLYNTVINNNFIIIAFEYSCAWVSDQGGHGHCCTLYLELNHGCSDFSGKCPMDESHTSQ